MGISADSKLELEQGVQEANEGGVGLRSRMQAWHDKRRGDLIVHE